MRWMPLLFSLGAVAAQDFTGRFEEIKRDATPAELYRFLWALPKGGDLHHHFTLSHYAEDWWDVATDPRFLQGNEYYTRVEITTCAEGTLSDLLFLNVPKSFYERLPECEKKGFRALRTLTPEQKSQWIASLKLDRPGEGRNEFFEAIVPRLTPLSRDANLILELMARLIKRYSEEGIRYVEMQAGPQAFVDPQGNPLPAGEGVRRFRELLARPDVKAAGVEVRFQVTVIRFNPQAEQALQRAYEFVDQNRDLWVAINMAGREDNPKGYALRFLPKFREMRRKYPGIHLSLHAGEMDSPGHEVRNTLLLGAERIGHGINLITDPEAMLLMRTGKFLMENSLVSNRLLEYTPDLSLHPFPEFLRLGIPVCLNTDDQGSWDSNLTDEYMHAVPLFRLTWDEVVRLGRHSLEYSFAPHAVKVRLLADYEQAIQAFEQRFGAADWRAELKSVRPRFSGYAKRYHGVE